MMDNYQLQEGKEKVVEGRKTQKMLEFGEVILMITY
jgi:hypothetical protein